MSSPNRYLYGGVQNIGLEMSTKDTPPPISNEEYSHQKLCDEKCEEADVETEFDLNNSCDGDVEEADDVQMQPRPPSSTLLLEQSGGRDSGISTDSSKFQDFFVKVFNFSTSVNFLKYIIEIINQFFFQLKL